MWQILGCQNSYWIWYPVPYILQIEGFQFELRNFERPPYRNRCIQMTWWCRIFCCRCQHLTSNDISVDKVPQISFPFIFFKIEQLDLGLPQEHLSNSSFTVPSHWFMTSYTILLSIAVPGQRVMPNELCVPLTHRLLWGNHRSTWEGIGN